MAFRKYKFGPTFEGGEEIKLPPFPKPSEKEEIGNVSINEVNTDEIKDSEKPKLVRVIDNTDSLIVNTENDKLEKINENENEVLVNNEILEEKTKEIETEIKETEEKEKRPILKKVEEKVTNATGWDTTQEVKLGVFSFKNKSERTVFLAFIIPPLIISIISMIHVVTFFELSNNTWLSWSLAAAFEFASIAALFALTALTKIKKNTIWILFFAIVLMQVIGNMYHSYIHIEPTNPDLLKLLSILGIDAQALPWTLRILGFLQGGVLPIVALTFVKAVVEYLSVNREEKNNV